MLKWNHIYLKWIAKGVDISVGRALMEKIKEWVIRM
jgi:hypothetical protein